MGAGAKLRCPECGRDVGIGADACRTCGFPCDEITHDILGEPASPRGLSSIGAAWTVAIAASLLLRPGWLAGTLITLMATHLGRLLVLGAQRPRLVVTARGATVVRDGRRSSTTRWHLFDEARVEPRRVTPGDRSLWRLTLVNAYKPSISTYLHSRDTDAPIFSPCIEFDFAANPATASLLAQELQQTIASARRGYRVLQLDDMHLPPPDPDLVLALQRCPACAGPLGRPTPLRCAACGVALDRTMFPLDGTLLQPRAARSVGDDADPLLYASDAGLQVWHAGGSLLRYGWDELPEFRAERMESGDWRLAFWDRARRSIGFNRLLYRWWTVPGGGPAVDVLLRGDPRIGPIVRDAIERRRVSRRAV